MRAAGQESDEDEEDEPEEVKEAFALTPHESAEFLDFLSDIVQNCAAKELKVPTEDEQLEDGHST